ncbi:hypothetical protein DVB69_15080 [Sporosarcina sp. BI001-red]|uniref:hypothetical protein n=1 Tax=Sporosarcina sp. BI001-red TaxID=2282866 RepID=UPI000E25F4B6|nr:hypothetical protein [Sporosarcina sp. BI001-red]REB05589.1 hypothetical protein DVB69_15080 [Sporosarcina sp. BI001-red]
MPSTIAGRIAFAMFVVFVLQIASIFILFFTNPLMGIVVIIISTILAGPIFLVTGTLGAVFEDGPKKAIPFIVLGLGIAELAMFLYVAFGFEFGG